jgi:tetratricopeptide (TPR) repeat protein
LSKSIEVSINNPLQKGISFIELGNIFYEEENYPQAQANYDSSLAFIDQKYTHYELVSKRSTVLTDLISYLNTIELNDSLLQLSNMSGKELEAYLYKNAVDIIDAEIKQEEKAKQSNVSSSEAEISSDKGDKNAWYFYSEASRSSGYKKFKQIWGDIILEDNWRRSEKSSELTGIENDDSSNKKDEYFARIDAQYEAMLASVPQSEVDKSTLNNEIIESFYNAALLYKLELENQPKSIEMFESLISRFPKNKFEAEALYQLYVLYKDVNDLVKADKAKNNLLTNYPSNKYSDFIKNPNKIEELNSKTSSENFYNTTYKLYESKQFDAVISQCEEAKSKFASLPIMAKFDLLKAMAIGGKQEYEAFVSSLEYVVSTYKSTEEEEKASEILAYLRGEDPTIKDTKVDVKTNTKVIDKNAINNSQDLKKVDSKSVDDGGLKIKFGEKEMNLGGKKGASTPVEPGPK